MHEKVFSQNTKTIYNTFNYFFRFGCDISYNDRSTRSAHEKKKHGSNFREAQVNGAATQQLNHTTIPGSHI